MSYLLKLLQWLWPGLPADPWVQQLAFFALAIVAAGIVIMLPVGLVLVFNWSERKVAAHMQDRLGPMRVGGWHGWAQSFADGIKLLFKEDIIPGAVDRPMFILAPFLIFVFSMAAFATIPWAKTLFPADLNIGILYIMAVSGVVVPGIIMAGWASANKWSLFGAMRGAAQIVSYEIPAAICVATVAIWTGSLSLLQIAETQRGGIWHWNAFRFEGGLGLLLFPLFVIYYLCTLAETNRTPFDIPEAESELVAGYHTEYSGMRFAFFYLAEYANMFLVGAVASVLFLGGYQSALPDALAIPPLPTAALFLGILVVWVVWYLFAEKVLGLEPRSIVHRLPGYLLALAAIAVALAGTGAVPLIAKGLFIVFVQMWHRWTFPRLRVDQLMAMSWKYLLPASFAILLGVAAIAMFRPSPYERWQAAQAKNPAAPAEQPANTEAR